MRLKGEPFKEEYVPSTEIQVANVHWTYKDSPDIIKVEAWDVVDRGRPRSSTHNKGLMTQHIPEVDRCLDAGFLDVYHGAHGVILVMDMTKSWSFEYICRELPRVPVHLPVLVMANHRDMGHHRTVTEAQVRAFLESEQANPTVPPPGSPDHAKFSGKRRSIRVQYCETSMRNGFGLLYLHKFFSLPFLCLRRSVLKEQLRCNEVATAQVVAELETDDSLFSTSQAAYESYLKMRRERSAFLAARNQTATNESKPSVPQNHQSSIPSQQNFQPSKPFPALSWNGPIISADVLVHHEQATTMDISNQKTMNSHTPSSCPNTHPIVLAVQDEIDPLDVICQVQPSELSSSVSWKSDYDVEGQETLGRPGDSIVTEDLSSITSAEFAKIEFEAQGSGMTTRNNLHLKQGTIPDRSMESSADGKDMCNSWDWCTEKEWARTPDTDSSPQIREVELPTDLATITKTKENLVISLEDKVDLERFLSNV